MSLAALAIVLAAAVAHATWNIVAHGVSRAGLPFLWWAALASAVIWAPVILFTGGIRTGDVNGFLLGIAVSAVLHVAYMLVLLRGYNAGSLSTVYTTARGSGPTISVIAAVLLLGERPSVIALVGVAAILVGVVATGVIDARANPLPTTRRGPDPAIVYGLLTGVAIAAYTLWDSHIVRETGASPVAFMVGCVALEVVIYTVLLRGRVRELPAMAKAQWRKILVFGVLSPLSYILILFAVTLAPVALVAPTREVSVVIVSVFGALVLREGKAGWRIGASLVVVAGIVLLAF